MKKNGRNENRRKTTIKASGGGAADQMKLGAGTGMSSAGDYGNDELPPEKVE